jgi:hypothetical protein
MPIGQEAGVTSSASACSISSSLSDNAMAVTQAMRQWHPREDDRGRHVERVERVLTSFQDGSFLVNRPGAAWSSIRISRSCRSIFGGGSRMSMARRRQP